MKTLKLRHEFVEYIPNNLEERTVYVSMKFATAIHKCCCGCGQEVVTPLTPNDWSITFNGEDISLQPSIGNWKFKCRSHYWIKNNSAIWIPTQLYRGKRHVDENNMKTRKKGLFNKWWKRIFK